jgi:hypothetical protein
LPIGLVERDSFSALGGCPAALYALNGFGALLFKDAKTGQHKFLLGRVASAAEFLLNEVGEIGWDVDDHE